MVLHAKFLLNTLSSFACIAIPKLVWYRHTQHIAFQIHTCTRLIFFLLLLLVCVFLPLKVYCVYLQVNGKNDVWFFFFACRLKIRLVSYFQRTHFVSFTPSTIPFILHSLQCHGGFMRFLVSSFPFCRWFCCCFVLLYDLNEFDLIDLLLQYISHTYNACNVFTDIFVSIIGAFWLIIVNEHVNIVQICHVKPGCGITILHCPTFN